MSPPPLRLGPGGLQVFAVDHVGAQVTWSALGPGRVTFTPGRGPVVTVDLEAAGPGSVWLGGLPPGTAQAVVVEGPGLAGGPAHLIVRTLDDPGGEAVAKVATVSDVHIGTPAFGHRGRLAERPHPGGFHTDRCLAAALAEAVAWGADVVVVKGDVTDTGHPRQWRRAAALLAEVPVPVLVMPGNHDLAAGDPDAAAKPAAEAGVALVGEVVPLDLPGVRVVLGGTVLGGHHHGSVREIAGPVVDAAAGAAADGRPTLVLLHHHLHRTVPTSWPPGVPGHESWRFLDRLAEANPRSLVSSGHSHRHRRRQHGPVTVTQVGSVKDYPGVWAGYTAFAGGALQQVVHRVGRPDCLAWTDHTRRAVLGTWRWWSPGGLDTRCFTI